MSESVEADDPALSLEPVEPIAPPTAEELAVYRTLPSPDATVVLDLNGRIRWINDKYTQLFGFTLDEMLRRPPFSLLHPHDREVANGLLLAQFGTEGLPEPGFVRMRAKDGSWHHVQVAMRPVPDAGTGPVIHASIRRADDRWAPFLAALAEDEPFISVIEWHAAALRGVLLNVTCADSATDDDGTRIVFSHEPLPAAIVDALASLEPSTPWGESAMTCEPVFDETMARWPTDARAAANELGFVASHCHAVEDPSGRPAAVMTAMLRSPAAQGYVQWAAMQGAARYLRMTLRNRHQREQLAFAARHDPLTGLPNRKPFFESLRGDGDAERQRRAPPSSSSTSTTSNR